MADPIIAAPVDKAAAAQGWLEGLDRAARRSETPCGDGTIAWRGWGQGPAVLLLLGGGDRGGLLREARPYAEVAVVSGAGHWLFYEASDRFNETFGKILAE